MTADRWERVKKLFAAAHELDADERAAFLARECGDDADLRREVESLVAHWGTAPALLESPPLTPVGRALLGDQPDALVGQRVGPYRLTRLLAVGGMGAVYAAARDDGVYEKELAVKLIRQAVHDEHTSDRFREERQTLANLNHPFIAHLFDGGVTDDHLPFLVMEYVDGRPIDEHCDEQGLDTRDRLRLFMRVCQAVQYAHQNLVIHRDLKPGNIMVTKDGNPKLLDFGIAKVLEPGSSPERNTAETRQRAMTLEYASPEQIQGHPITTASDVYSLGVVLYELLTGMRPYRFKSRIPHDIERAVCEQEPDKPSTAVRRTADIAAADAGPSAGSEPRPRGVAREAARRNLVRRLAGDVDAIVLKALRKEPEHRYASVEQLADDIRRHLDGLPVLARRGTWNYRAAKFAKRNKTGLAAAAVVAVSLAAGVVGIAWQAHVAANERDAARLAEERAMAEVDHARIESDSAGEMTDLLVEILQSSTISDKKRQQDVLAGLDYELERVRRQYADRSHLQANLIDGIGRVFMALSEFDRARTVMEEARSIRLSEFGAESLEVARSLNSLGELAFALGQYQEAADLFRQVWELNHRLPPGVHTDIGLAANNLAVALRALGNLNESEKLHREALAVRMEGGGPNDPTVAESLNNLAGIHLMRADYAAAAEALREALAIRRKTLGEHHPLVAQALNNLALTLHHAGDVEEAERLFRESLAEQRAMPNTSEEGIATTLTTLAELLRTRGELEESAQLLEEAAGLTERLFGPDHLKMSLIRSQFARLKEAQGDLNSARAHLEEVLRIRRLALPEGHLQTGIALKDYGQVLTALGELDAAEWSLRRAVHIYRAELPPQHWHQAVVSAALGNCLLKAGQVEEAEPLLRSALDVLRGARGEDAPETAKVERFLADLEDLKSGARSAPAASENRPQASSP